MWSRDTTSAERFPRRSRGLPGSPLSPGRLPPTVIVTRLETLQRIAIPPVEVSLVSRSGGVPHGHIRREVPFVVSAEPA